MTEKRKREAAEETTKKIRKDFETKLQIQEEVHANLKEKIEELQKPESSNNKQNSSTTKKKAVEESKNEIHLQNLIKQTPELGLDIFTTYETTVYSKKVLATR